MSERQAIPCNINYKLLNFNIFPRHISRNQGQLLLHPVLLKKYTHSYPYANGILFGAPTPPHKPFREGRS